MKRNRSHQLLFSLSLLGAALTFGCAEEDPTIINNGGGQLQGGSSGESGNGGSESGSGGGGSDEPTCVETPSAPEDFLQRCTDSACRPFDNVSRLSLYREGEPLPEVP